MINIFQSTYVWHLALRIALDKAQERLKVATTIVIFGVNDFLKSLLAKEEKKSN
jgi:hypothetical protein